METEKQLTGYPSIDKPWLKYYTEESINTELPKCTIYEYLYESSKDYLDSVALNYFGRKISFGKLLDNIEKASRALASLNIKPGDIVIMVTVTIPETIYIFYALNRLGAIANMVDPRTSIGGIKEYITEVNARYVISLDVVYPKIENALTGTGVEQVVIISPADSLTYPKKVFFNAINRLKGIVPKYKSNCITWDKLIKRGENLDYVNTDYQKNKCCAVEHTGGTTGTPKGVMLTDDNFNAAAFQIKNSPLRLKKQDRFLNIMPPFIAYGMVLGIHTALTCGWESILIPQFSPDAFSTLILKYHPEGIMGVPAYFEGLMEDSKLKDADLSYIKVVLVGGDKTQIEFEKRVNTFFETHNANIHLSKGYSMTEASATATFSFEEINKLGSAGIPFAQTIISVFEPETHEELKVNETGEICICSPTMMNGYFGKQMETDRILRKHSDGKVWIHSGDLGHIDEDGCVYIDGRLKRMIIRHDGFKVFPPLIENIVATHKAVEMCCTVGIDDKAHSQGKLPVVHIVLKKEFVGKEVEVEKELSIFCKKELPEYAQPVAYKFLDSLPLTSIGKIDFKTLEEKYNVEE